MQGKVRVVKGLGDGSTLGLMDPQVNMVTDKGTIKAIDSEGVCTMGDTAAHLHGGRSRFYPHQLYVLRAEAVSRGWPGGADCVTLGHSGVHSSGSERQVRTSIIPGGSIRTDPY